MPRVVLVRQPNTGLTKCITRYGTPSIDVPAALAQWQNYVDCIRKYAPGAKLIQIPTDPAHPDCCFIEDTVVVCGGVALITHMGHPSRLGETKEIVRAFVENADLKQVVSKVVQMEATSEATLDGGDVMFTGRHMFVGESKRTNAKGREMLKRVFGEQIPVLEVKIPETELHLRSICSYIDQNTLVMVDCDEGRKLYEIMSKVAPGYSAVWVTDPVSVNVLSLTDDKVLFVQGSDHVELQKWADKHGWTLVCVDMSEFVKTDAALTCQSVLIF